MAFEVTFDSEKVNRFFSQINKNVKDVKQKHKLYVDSISIHVFKDVMDHFSRELGSSGKWVKWSDIYAERQKDRGRSKILQDSGALRNKFTPANYRSRVDGIEWYNNAKVKSGFPYAYAHNEGGPKLPKRDFMWLSNKSLDIISEITASYYLKGV